MEQDRDLLKDLYLKRFFLDQKPSTTLDKVIHFQKKIQDFKISRHSVPKTKPINSDYFLQEEGNHFRPTTNHTSYRVKREKNSNSLQGNKIEGPATAQLRLIFDKKYNGDMIVAENRLSNNYYSANNHRKRMKLLSHRESYPYKNEQQQATYKKKMAAYLGEDRISAEQRIAKPIIYLRRDGSTFEEAQQEDGDRKKPSKKVFIGGRNLEKAAEEYSQLFKEMRKNIINNEIRMKQMNAPPAQKKNADIRKRKVQKKVSKNRKIAVTNMLIPNSKTEPKKLKYDASLDLNPWNVDVDYY